MLDIIIAAIFGIIQGITEWLPISSTGHLILAEQFLKMNVSQEFTEMFRVVIQFGSILAVVALYFHKLNPFSPKKTHKEKKDTINLWIKVIIAVIPAGVIGVIFDDTLDAMFYNAWTVAATLIIYGILFLLLESRKKTPSINSFEQLDYKTALAIGACQILALIPGTSRSGSTILGAVFLGASRFVAAEFSFFLAVPVMLGASLLKLVKFGFAFSGLEWTVLLTGMLVAFVVSIMAIKFLVDFVKKHDFKPFGYYRIVLGIVILIYFLAVR